MTRRIAGVVVGTVLLFGTACSSNATEQSPAASDPGNNSATNDPSGTTVHPIEASAPVATDEASPTTNDVFANRLVSAAIERTTHRVRYDGSYRRIDYPGGDVPKNIGVCTDVVIRSYRALGIDLQQLVHEDMAANFSEYPDKWGLDRPDTNIDHRRVPNLRRYFERQNASIPVTTDPDDYLPGDLVTWMLPGNLPHIGIVTDQRSRDSRRPLIAHNIGAGPKIEDMLLVHQITGHYRFHPRSD